MLIRAQGPYWSSARARMMAPHMLLSFKRPMIWVKNLLTSSKWIELMKISNWIVLKHRLVRKGSIVLLYRAKTCHYMLLRGQNLGLLATERPKHGAICLWNVKLRCLFMLRFLCYPACMASLQHTNQFSCPWGPINPLVSNNTCCKVRLFMFLYSQLGHEYIHNLSELSSLFVRCNF